MYVLGFAKTNMNGSIVECKWIWRATTSYTSHGTLWARITQNVKKPPLTVNVMGFEVFGFSVSIWVPFWSPLTPTK